MSWKYIAGDNYNLHELLEYEKFYLDDLSRAVNDYNVHEAWVKFGLPNFRVDQLRRIMTIEESKVNLDRVREVIRVIERENK